MRHQWAPVRATHMKKKKTTKFRCFCLFSILFFYFDYSSYMFTYFLLAYMRDTSFMHNRSAHIAHMCNQEYGDGIQYYTITIIITNEEMKTIFAEINGHWIVVRMNERVFFFFSLFSRSKNRVYGIG